ncbi:MAG: menaquinone biosynthesis protein [Planctomycetota bacterium]
MTRLGAIRYLNALPLVYGLEDEPAVTEVRYAVPSLLAEDLRSCHLDLALVPQVEATREPSYRIVPGLCIACQGPAESILLFSTREWSRIRRVGVDLSSHTSVELLKVLFHLRGGPIPELVTLPPRLDPLRESTLDAMLLIGDRALVEDHGEFPRFDLGALWTEETQLPFVFAVWLGREGLSPEVVETVQRVAQQGLKRRNALADDFCREHPEVLDQRGARRYLNNTIRYTLGNAELESLLTFHQLRVASGSSVQENWKPQFFEVAP